VAGAMFFMVQGGSFAGFIPGIIIGIVASLCGTCCEVDAHPHYGRHHG
jgi:hypothetical protein